MRFLFVGPVFCLRLPSDSTSRWTPLPGPQGTCTPKSSGQDHLYRNSARQGATRHAWRTTEKAAQFPERLFVSGRTAESSCSQVSSRHSQHSPNPPTKPAIRLQHRATQPTPNQRDGQGGADDEGGGGVFHEFALAHAPEADGGHGQQVVQAQHGVPLSTTLI